MANLLKISAWIVFYLVTSVFSLLAALFTMDIFWPSYDVSEQSSGPVEQQFYMLLVDRGYWMTGDSRKSQFRNGMTEQGRERFTTLIKNIRFKKDCLGGADKKDGEEMTCTVNGEEIDFVDYGR